MTATVQPARHSELSDKLPGTAPQRLAQTFFGTAFSILSVYLFVEYNLSSLRITGALPPMFAKLSSLMNSAYADLTLFVFSAAIGLLVTIYVERNRIDQESIAKLHYWTRTIVRYFLAFIFFTYGFAKVFHDQFSTPLSALDTPLGEVSGISLTWRFFGYSYAYAVFVASSQIIAGLLFFFRRTTTLGALLLLPVISNIVFINFAYRIPVKLYSIAYLLMTCFLLLPDVRRLKALVWGNQPFGRPVFSLPHFGPGAAAGVKFLIAAVLLAGPIAQNYHGYVTLMRSSSPLAGRWLVDKFVLNNQPVAESEESTWRRLYVDSDKIITIRAGTSQLSHYLWSFDPSRHSLAMTTMAGKPYFQGAYSLDGNKLAFSGEIQGRPVRAEFTRR